MMSLRANLLNGLAMIDPHSARCGVPAAVTPADAFKHIRPAPLQKTQNRVIVTSTDQEFESVLHSDQDR
jgi:hypothetical protein